MIKNPNLKHGNSTLVSFRSWHHLEATYMYVTEVTGFEHGLKIISKAVGISEILRFRGDGDNGCGLQVKTKL